MEEGTGIVHIAPGCGAEDFELARVHDLAVLTPVDEAGRFYDAYGWLHGSSTAEAKEPELSSIFQPVMSIALEPLFVTSNQSEPTGLPLDHGATSEMMSVGLPGFSFTTSVTARLKDVVASGVEPTEGSSTLTVTA